MNEETDLQNRKLILVSNAEPYAHHWKDNKVVCEKIAGGLTSALDPLMQSCEGTWIAWGRGDADFEAVGPGGIVRVPEEGGNSYRLKRLELTEEEIDGFYYGFSNEVLWPISHSLVGRTTLEDYKATKKKWRIYQEVNQKYANATIGEITGEDDLIWVHDYHLTLVPEMIKEEQPDSNIATFWHIPWSPWEMFGSLPWREEIMSGLLNNDFIGFHTPEIKTNFFRCAERLGYDINREESTIKDEEHETRIGSFPIGIDYDNFSSIAEREEYKNEAEKLRDNFPAEKIILSVDRLDYTKGIPQRLRAFELFLEKYPKFQGKVTLVQRIPPSRSSVKEYQSILEKINRIVGEINGKLEKIGWTPIKSFHRFLPKQEMLVPYYIAADVALLTPLKDGMNLVSKEYVACTNDGVLILSEFAGASERMEEAIRVNPYDSEQVAEAIKQALEMDPDERKKRLSKLKERVKEEDLGWWRNQFLKEWTGEYLQETCQ